MKKTFLILFIGLFFIIFFVLSKNQKGKSLKVTQLKSMIKIQSSAFKQGEMIPEKYTCKGEDINPPLTIENVPTNAKSLALIIDDPDAPMETFTHWLLWNINPKTKEIKENSLPAGAILGINDFGKTAYGGPCPPSGVHRYYFKVYALDIILDLPAGANRSQLEKAIEGHILDYAELMGRFQK
ncbi:MAG: YbhB/YbcL family Raf kinase inhibitor-like protein [Microgenomates group bacterium]